VGPVVGAVISGHYSGWNLGLLAGGWGGFALATALIATMYLGLVFCIAEMGAALPHTGGAYSFARASMAPWGGFVTGLCENVEYVLTPAVVVCFLATYLGAVFETPARGRHPGVPTARSGLRDTGSRASPWCASCSIRSSYRA
jgi:ethanolamine permease